MSKTAFRPWGDRRWRWAALTRASALAGLLALLSSCVEEPLPQRKISRYDCLREVNLSRLQQAIQLCDQVVAAFPADPLPLNERFLLHSLAGKDDLACKDIARAVGLAKKIPTNKIEPMLAKDLELRQASCRD